MSVKSVGLLAEIHVFFLPFLEILYHTFFRSHYLYQSHYGICFKVNICLINIYPDW